VVGQFQAAAQRPVAGLACGLLFRGRSPGSVIALHLLDLLAQARLGAH
jgi:hypothetical protein